MLEPRMAARRVHRTVNSGKTQSFKCVRKNKNAKNFKNLIQFSTLTAKNMLYFFLEAFMENQTNTAKQNISQVGQNPVSQTAITPVEKPINYWMVSTIASLAILVALGVYTFNLSNRISQLENSIQIPTELPTAEPSSDEATPIAMNKISLSDTLSKFCVSNKILLDKMPFTLSQALKNAYKVQNSIECYFPDESYARISIVINNPSEFTGDDRIIYFFHQGSQFQGMADAFQSLSNYKAVTINGQGLYLWIMDPGPYGISTQGVWVQFISEKKDSTTGTIVRAFNLEIFKDQDILDLVKKYGVKQTDPSSPEYVITDPNKKIQFIEEVVKLASQHNSFIKPAQDVISDLNAVAF